MHQVEYWRRSYSGCPPGGESLKTTAARCIPYLKEKILPLVFAGENVIVSAHGNSLRAIIMYLMEYSSDQILKTEVCVHVKRADRLWTSHSVMGANTENLQTCPSPPSSLSSHSLSPCLFESSFSLFAPARIVPWQSSDRCSPLYLPLPRTLPQVGWCEPIIVTFNENQEVASLHCVPRPGTESRTHLPEKATMVETVTGGARNSLPIFFPLQVC